MVIYSLNKGKCILIEINPLEQTERDNYKLLIGTVVPRPIAFITSEAIDGTINGAPFSYFNVVTADPPMLSVSIQRKNDRQKDTAKNILAKGNFVIHIVSKDYVEKINQTAASLAEDESEITLASLTLAPSTHISTPGIEEAKVRYECVMEQHLPLGSDGQVTTDFFIAKVQTVHIAEEVYDDGKIVYEELAAMSRLAGNDYAEIGDITTIKRPD